MKREKILFAFVIFILLLILIQEKRQFYSFADGKQWVTVWRQLNGQSYIISGKYYGLFSPEENYIKTPSGNAVTVVFDPLADYMWVVSNDYGFPIEVCFPNNCIYVYEDRKKFTDKYYPAGKFIGLPYEFLLMDLSEGLVVKNGVRLSPK